MRYSAPDDTPAISLTCGEFAAVDGFIDLPDDLGQGDLAGLASNGFRPAPASSEPELLKAVEAAPTPAPESKPSPDPEDPA